MRKIDLKDFTHPPAFLVNISGGRKVKKACVEKSGKVYSGYHYKNETVRDLLKAYSLGKSTYVEGDDPKCFYCESTHETSGTLQVEHYRPKDGVDKKDNNNVSHPGYYWLGIEWSNLLLACPNCNGKSNKGIRFPIEGPRAVPFNPVKINNTIDRRYLYSNATPLLDEKPLLLNPEIDNPDDHLIYLSNAQIKGIDIKGKTSVEIYNLHRTLLLKARKKALVSYTKQVKLYVIAHQEKRGVDDSGFDYLVRTKLIEMIQDAQNLASNYNGWRKFYCNNFITTFLPEIHKDYKIKILQIYKEVKTKHWI